MNRASRWALATIRSPLVWGGLAALGFYALVHANSAQFGTFARYFVGHWSAYVATCVFFVAAADLLLRGFDVAEQRAVEKEPLLGDRPAGPRPAIEAQRLLDQLELLPFSRKHHYLPRRLHDALAWIVRRGGADGLDDELERLARRDRRQAHAGRGLVRACLVALPLVGLFGAAACYDPAENTPYVGMGYSAGPDDTSRNSTFARSLPLELMTLGLGLTVLLIGLHFRVASNELRLLEQVDQRSVTELAGRFELFGEGNAQLNVVRRMGETVLRACEAMVARQAEVWKTTIDATHERWAGLTEAAQRQLEAALETSLATSLRAHGEQLAMGEAAIAERNHKHWERVQQALLESASASRSQQIELAKQGDLLLRVIDATAQVAQLENTLNANLAALSGAQHFEETMLNLSAALHLLNARLGQVVAMGPQVTLHESPTAGRAA